MNVELDGMKLVEHVRDTNTGATKELRSVYNLSISEKRSIVEHKIPGLEGGILKDFGRELVRIYFDGIIYGETAKDDLEKIRARYKAGKPVPFSSDISGVAEVILILIEELHVTDRGGTTNRYEYSLALREYFEPPPPSQPPPSQEKEAEKEVKKQSEIDDIRGQILDSDGNPIKDVTVKISGPNGKFEAKTDDQGYYEILDVPEGTYEVTVDAEGYEDMKEEVEIAKGGGET